MVLDRTVALVKPGTYRGAFTLRAGIGAIVRHRPVSPKRTWSVKYFYPWEDRF